MELSLKQFDELSPLFAYLDQKSDSEQEFILHRYAGLLEKGQSIMVDVSTAETILSLIQEKTIPDTHGKVVAVMIALLVFGEITTDQLVPLLEKLGLNNNQASKTADSILVLTRPFLAEKNVSERPDMTPLPPATRPTENGPRVLVPKPNVPDRNIIDLRNKNE